MGYQSVRVKPKEEWVNRADALYNKIMSKKSDDDKRTSKLDNVKLERFPIGLTAKIAIAVSSVFVFSFAGLAIAGQISLLAALLGGVVGSLLSSAAVYQI